MKTTVWLALPPPGAESGANVTDWKGGCLVICRFGLRSLEKSCVLRGAYHAMACKIMLARVPCISQVVEDDTSTVGTYLDML